MPIESQYQAQIIIKALREIRPRWAEKALERILHENRDHPAHYGRILQAAINYALNDAKTSPAFIFEDGPWWITPPEEPRPVGPITPCEDHPTEHAATCRSCQGDINAGDRPEHYKGRHYDPHLKEAA